MDQDEAPLLHSSDLPPSEVAPMQRDIELHEEDESQRNRRYLVSASNGIVEHLYSR